jgi:putative ABC transport system permease protein
MIDLSSDLRFVLRGLRRSRGFAFLAVVTLGLGIGGTTALFSMVDAVLLRALPYHESDRLVEMWGQEGERTGMRIPGPIVDALRERSGMLVSIATHGPSAGVWRTADEVFSLRGDHVSANFLDVLGVTPLLGRGFAPDEDRAGAPAVILIGFEFWQEHLGGDPGVVGRTIQLDSTVYTILGVMSADFQTQFRGPVQDFWTTHVDERTRAFEQEDGYELVARLSANATVDRARREAQSIAASVSVEDWADGDRRLGMVRLIDEVVRDSADVLKLLLAAMAAVLAIACANLAQLLLARSDQRVTEFATRKAIGATSVQLFRLALLESLTLSLAGGALGVLLAYWLVPVLLSLAPTEIPRLADATVDVGVLMVALVLTVLTGCLFGTAPALRLSRGSITEAMKGGHRSGSPGPVRFHSGLMVAQVTASVALFTVAGLLLQTFLALLPTDPGFEAPSRSSFGLSLNAAQFANAQERRVRIDDLLRRIEAHPGVTGAAIASNIPFSTDEYLTLVTRADDAFSRDSAAGPRADVRAISPNYFELLRMSLLRGRPFSEMDGPESPLVAIINERLSRSLGTSSDLLGQWLRIGESQTGPVYEIVGVVSDARSTGNSVDALNEVYVPFAQSRSTFGLLVVHANVAPPELTEIIRTEVHAVLPQVALRRDQRATALTDLIRRSLGRQRFAAVLVSAFSSIALLLSLIGVFGLVSYSISQRWRELGVRAALGARPLDLGVTTVRPVLALTATGIALGSLAAVYLTRFIENMLYAVEPFDVPTFAGAALGIFIVAGVAAFIPARRAATTDPCVALRQD